MEIRLEPRKIIRVLIIVVILLTLANIAGQVSILYFKQDSLFGLVPLFNLDYERSIPTFYSAITLLFCAALLAIIANVGKSHAARYPRHWLALSFIFLFLSADEMLALHERLIGPIRAAFHTSGLLYFAWVIPYGVLLLIFLALFHPFWKRLPTFTRRQFLIAGSLYVLGALGFDLLGGYYYDLRGDNIRDVVYAILFTTEELLEMAGVILFIYALLQYMQRILPDLCFTISPASER